MPEAIHHSGYDPAGLVYLAVVLAVVFAPILFARRRLRPESDSGPDDGRGGRPPSPPTKPMGPRGGIPLPDAEQSVGRLRDHGRLADRSSRSRGRHIHAPERRRQRTTA